MTNIDIPISENVEVVLRWDEKEYLVGAGKVTSIRVDRDYMTNVVRRDMPVEETWTVTLTRPWRDPA